MPTATMTSEGRLTIPVEVRRTLGLRPGSRIAFVPTESGGYEIHPEAASIKDLKGAEPPPKRPVSGDEMNEAVATAAAENAR